MVTRSRLPSEDGSLVSSESAKLNSGRGSLVQKVPPPQKMAKEEPRKRTGERPRERHTHS